MNPIIPQLAAIIKERLFEEKWLIVPNLRVGHQWLDLTAKHGFPVINVHLKTLSRIARDIIEEDRSDPKYVYIDTQKSAVILRALWNDLFENDAEYFHSITPNLTFFQKLISSVESIYLAGIESDRIQIEFFETNEKGNDFIRLIERYEDYLSERGWMDRAGIFRCASMVYKKKKHALSQEILLIIPDDLELSAVESQFLDTVKEERLIPLSIPSVLDFTHEPQNDFDLLRWSINPTDAPEPFCDGSVKLFSSIGVTNEIREVFRRCMKEEIPLDAVEVLYTDADCYLPRIYETAVALFSDKMEGPPPITFADGVPIRYSRPGRLLHCWMNWIRSGFSQSVVIQMLEDGLLDHPIFDGDSKKIENAVRLFRSTAIGSGIERYPVKLQQAIDARSEQIKDSFILYDAVEDSSEGRHQKLMREIEVLESIKTAVSNWREIIPQNNFSSAEELTNLSKLLTHYSRCSSELDRNALNRIGEELESMKQWMSEIGESASFNGFEWIESTLQSLTVLGSSPREGCVHVSSIQNGGHSGREYTFIIGLDDGTFPGLGLQDPFLLDRERISISPNLSLASAHQKNVYDRFYRLLARIAGKLTLSYSCKDVSDDRECFPSSILLNLYRIFSNERDGDQSSLEKWLYPPASFCPRDSTEALSETELWLSTIAGQSCGYNALEDAVCRYPFFQRGLMAMKARLSDEYTPFDGWVFESGKDLDPVLPHGLIMSASKFETLGQCPLRFFFENALKLKLPEDIEIDPDVWLNPLQFGSLLHELFESFVQELIDGNEKPIFDRHWPRLKQLIDELSNKYKEYYPPANQSVFTRQYIELQHAAAIFLHDEEEHEKLHTPVFVEASLGVPLRKQQKSLQENPQRVSLPNGKAFRTRGIIDRVDRIGDEAEHQYSIWDYKSGGTYKYDRNDPFRQGRVLQHSLYYEMMSDWLKERVSPNAKLVYFGYFFPSEKGKGTRISWTEPELTRRANLFQSLCQIVTNGAYAPTNDVKDCEFCDFRMICRDVNAVTKASGKKLQNKLNVQLQPFKELRINE